MPQSTASKKEHLFALLFFTVGTGTYLGFLNVILPVDFQNYHYYIGYSLVNDRLFWDIAPAAFRTYFTPTLDAAFYFLSKHLPFFLFKFITGAFAGLAFYWTWAIARFIFGKIYDGAYCQLLVWCSMLYGIFAHNVLDLLGRWNGEPMIGVFATAGLYYLLVSCDSRHMRIPQLLFSGLCLGASMGLKLTTTYLSVGYLAAFGYVGWKKKRWRPVVLAGFFLGAGALVSGGYWIWTMFSNFQNPIFPMMNSIFESPWADAGGDFRGTTRRIPSSVTEFLLLPFSSLKQLALFEDVSPILSNSFEFSGTHLPFLFATAYVFVLVKLWTWRSWLGQRFVFDSSVQLNVYYFFAFYAWAYGFAIIRYLYPIQLLSGIVLFLMLGKISDRRVIVAFVGLCMTVVSTWVALEHFRYVKSGEAPVFLSPSVALADQFLEFSSSGAEIPTKGVVIVPQRKWYPYFIPSLPSGLRFVGIENEMVSATRMNMLSQEARALIRDNEDMLYALFPLGESGLTEKEARKVEDAERALASIGLRALEDVCSRLVIEARVAAGQGKRVSLCKVVPQE